MNAPARRRRTRQQPEVRSEAIIDAAYALFSNRGFRGTSVTAVAREVGLTDAGVLHHFPTKRALLAAVLERSTQEHIDGFRSLVAPGGVAALRGLATWGEVMETGSQYTRLEITLSAEALEEGSSLHTFFETRYGVLRRWLIRAVARGIERGELRADIDAAHEVTVLIAFLDGVRLQWYFGAIESVADEVRTFVDGMIDRLRSDPAE